MTHTRGKNITLADISRFRGELMGIAMVLIILFHIRLPQTDLGFGLKGVGDVGVDMFMFLSGIGLWFSWTKTPSLKHFFQRRYLRVYPTWLIVACLCFIHGFDGNWLGLVANIVIDWDFWSKGDITFWYVPAIMMLYTFTPLYIKLIKKHPIYRWTPVLFIIWCVMVQWVTPINARLGYLEIFWSRIPIFLIGINMGKGVMEKRAIESSSIYLLIALFALVLGTCFYLEQFLHGKYPLFMERMLYIPFTIATIILLNKLLALAPKYISPCFKFIGLISLEAYLIHYQFLLYVNAIVLKLGYNGHLSYWATFLLTIAVTLPLSWVLYKFVLFVEHKIILRRSGSKHA